MSIQIELSNDVVENIVRPISCHLNDIPSGTVLVFFGEPSVHTYGKDDKTYNRYRFQGSDGNMYSFTDFDLSDGFSLNSVRLSKYFKVQANVTAYLASQFTVVNTVKRLTMSGEVMYPLFAYSGYDAYLLNSKLPNADKKALRNILFATTVNADDVDKYYRVIDIDVDIVYYNK